MIARRDRHFDTTYLTPTGGLQDAVVGLLDERELWRWVHSKALIKLDKTREEPKSRAAGERKKLILKSKPLLLICWSVCFLGMRTYGNDAPAWDSSK